MRAPMSCTPSMLCAGLRADGGQLSSAPPRLPAPFPIALPPEHLDFIIIFGFPPPLSVSIPSVGLMGNTWAGSTGADTALHMGPLPLQPYGTGAGLTKCLGRVVLNAPLSTCSPPHTLPLTAAEPYRGARTRPYVCPSICIGLYLHFSHTHTQTHTQRSLLLLWVIYKRNKCWQKPISSIKLYRISFYTSETMEPFPEPPNKSSFQAAAPDAFPGTISAQVGNLSQLKRPSFMGLNVFMIPGR